MMEWYRALSSKDQRILSLGLLFVVVASFYTFAYEPLEAAVEQNKMKLELKRSELAELKSISREYKALGTTPERASKNDKRSLLAIIDKSGTAVGIRSSIKRLTPEGDSKVRVRVENVAFDQLIKWLVTNSAKHSIHAELFMARQTEQVGRVNATVLLAR